VAKSDEGVIEEGGPSELDGGSELGTGSDHGVDVVVGVAHKEETGA